MLFQGTVAKVMDHGVVVQFGKNLTGLIRKEHVAEGSLKKFKKKFNDGDKIKCRVS